MTAARISPRGWCPSVDAPMASGDGLLVRVHPREGRIRADALARCARAARRHGNGTIDLTRRGSLQLRGVRPSTLEALRTDLAALELTGGDAGAQAWRHLLVSPLAGLDPSCRDLGAIAERMSEAEDIDRLPAKFLILLDGGGRLNLRDLGADIRFEAISVDPTLPVRVSLGGAATSAVPLGFCRAESIHESAIRLVTRALLLAPAQSWRMRDLLTNCGTAPFLDSVTELLVAPANARHHESVSPIGFVAPDERIGWFGLALPFGSGSAEAFEALADLARRFGDGTLRITPWRAVIVASVREEDRDPLRERAQAAGFITAPADPRLSLIACPGAPACASALGETRTPALRLVEPLRPRLGGTIRIHVSGCAKGCAASQPADIVLVAARSGYHLGFATTPAEAVMRPALGPARIDAELNAWAARGTHSSKGRTVMAKPRPDYIRDGAEIYRRSFAIIRREADLSRFTPDEAGVAVRIIHACGMVEIAGALIFSADLVAAAREAMRAGAPILCDSKMVANGITRARLPAENAIICTLADERVPALAKELGTTRTAAAMELWRERLPGAVVAIGNAPTALFRLLELLDAGMAPPAAIIGMPVGFVGAAESKEALAADGRVPNLIVRGRRGGSAMTVAAVNALASEAE